MLGEPSRHALAWSRAGVDWVVAIHGGGAGLYAVAVQHLSDWLLQAPPGELLLGLSPARGRAPYDDAISDCARSAAPLAKRRHHAAVLVGTPAAVRAEAAALRAVGREVCCMPRAAA
ncbi:hypothetical protein MNEG_5565 [Monoraphidium neglectum]|uniref:Uncharacterized protein n=1 Tax=Monoraphidium neglectum TaxID=145388 RepID=A0A0D2MH32_9CHLO|nr:hypothetical protein MNEG_5565 [Monoraphidium neglectum]KIZ02390.1 hypothetical protein MNEG_5565 [Monoraphidium neglectum]|eukprot:XP_013901409.1 hypothetical protein MNEG_5565 [Monoraphidium neglectum]